MHYIVNEYTYITRHLPIGNASVGNLTNSSDRSLIYTSAVSVDDRRTKHPFLSLTFVT